MNFAYNEYTDFVLLYISKYLLPLLSLSYIKLHPYKCTQVQHED